jgi:RNA polymerase sigma-70 factor (ECF subfamily)
MSAKAVDTSECSPADSEIIQRVLAGDVDAYEVIMRRHNQRLYRAARAILRNDDEAEDVIQEAYVRAYQHLRDFAGEAQFSTWLTRIAVNEALARLRLRHRIADAAESGDDRREPMERFASPGPGPEQQAVESEIRRVLEAAIDTLPEPYRVVFVLRQIEEMDTANTAACLDLSEETVKIRLHRSRRMLRRELSARAGAASSQAFLFKADRCDRVVRAVFAALRSSAPTA